MRKIFSILLFTLALLSFSNASAEEKHMIYSLLKFDKNLVTHDGEYGYNLKLRFYNYDKNFYLNSESYKVQVKLWNDQDMKVPFPYVSGETEHPQYVMEILYDQKHPLDQERTLFVPYDLFSKHMTSKLGGTYYSSCTLYYSIDVYRTSGSKPLVSIYPKLNDTGEHNAWFNYKLLRICTESDGALEWSEQASKEAMRLMAKYPYEDPEASDFSGQFVKISYQPFDGARLNHLDEFEVRVSFYHGLLRRDRPCMFYELKDEFDKNGNNRIYYAKEQYSQQAYKDENIEERSRQTNSIRRIRHDWEPFGIFIPEAITMLADEDSELEQKHENDTISAFVDIYSMDGALIYKNVDCHYWVRTPYVEQNIVPPTPTETEVLVKLGDSECKHVWGDIRRGDSDGNEIKTRISADKCNVMQTTKFNIYQVCMECGERRDLGLVTDVNIFPNYDTDAANQKCCPNGYYTEEVEKKEPVKVGDYERIDKTISTYYICQAKHIKRLVSKRNETEWRNRALCPPHDFIFEKKETVALTGKSTRLYHEEKVMYTYKCKKCGIKNYRYEKENHSHKNEKICNTCIQSNAWVFKYGGVEMKFHLAVNTKDSTAIYVAETEMTRAQWAELHPENTQGWKAGDNTPVTNVTPEDADIIIGNLNKYAMEKNLPLHFRLPTAQEWTYAYWFGGGDKEGWTQTNSGGVLHNVAELPANEMKVYDMKGGVSEMCSDTISTTNEDDEKMTLVAVAGSNFRDKSLDVGPTDIRYMDLSEGDDCVGLRIFAEPVLGDDGQLEPDLDMTVGEKSRVGGFFWTVRGVYQCKLCHRISYSPFSFSAKGYGDKMPIVCEQ